MAYVFDLKGHLSSCWELHLQGYSFCGLMPGSYTVLGTPPSGIFPCRTS
ncbi:MAG TPA: hypothetical protein PLW73_11775 [Methanoregulaceae archaeon]|nr:hypothetical protein [Methanoregulaceae archaeon]